MNSFFPPGSSAAESKEPFSVILIVIIFISVVVTLGIVFIFLFVLCILLRQRKSRKNDSDLPLETVQDIDLIDNDSYNITHVTLRGAPLVTRTDDDGSEPAVAPEYLSITNISHTHQLNSDTNSTLPVRSETEPEYLSVISNIGQLQQQGVVNSTSTPALQGHSVAVVPENELEYEYLSITSFQPLNPPNMLPLSEPNMPMASNPSYVTKFSGGVKMTQNGAYWTNRDAAALSLDAKGNTSRQSSTSHIEATSEDDEDYI